jgi:hypothetical protein
MMKERALRRGVLLPAAPLREPEAADEESIK